MSTVTVRNVSKAFGETCVLRDFDQVFQDGEFITLLGPSGCGKTTMLRMIAGFEKTTTGEILIGDTIVSSDTVFLPPEKRDIGMVFQSYAVWPHMTVFENVAYPLEIKKRAKREIAQKVAHVLDIVHLTQYAKRYPNQLSGGQQQRVALARALVAEPGLLLLDEPLSNLDAKLRESMRFEIKEIQNALGITVVYVTHDQTEAMAMSDRIVLINNGVVQQVASPIEIYDHPTNPFVADFVGKIDFLSATAQSGAVTIDGVHQSIPYAGEKRGRVLVGLRPENVVFTDAEYAQLTGVLKSHFFLGDVNDCRVALGEQIVRVVAPAETFSQMRIGDAVSMRVKSSLVFDYEDMHEELKIRT